uniref:Zgc:112416 n=1 Tax=Oncorhynchus kisutch TaxID=8019 RepID=A0A8C7GDP7_ONCKI
MTSLLLRYLSPSLSSNSHGNCLCACCLPEQHMLEDLSRPHTWGGTGRRYRPDLLPPPVPLPPTPAPIHIYQPALVPPAPPPPHPPPQPPRIIQQMLPQQPTTFIQQLPQQQPLIQQIPPPQPYPAPRSGSIKEDMVELMLMQNAQMHQIIMHNMMLKAIPPMALSPPNPGQVRFTHTHIIYVKSNRICHKLKPRGNAVHHHHYGPQAQLLPPIGYPMWPSMASSLPEGQGGPHMPSVQHVTCPITLPPLNMY